MSSRAQDADFPRRQARERASVEAQPDDRPVREYIGSMADELARMARWDGDEALARVLEAAARMSEQPAPHPEPIALAEAKRSGRS